MQAQHMPVSVHLVAMLMAAARTGNLKGLKMKNNVWKETDDFDIVMRHDFNGYHVVKIAKRMHNDIALFASELIKELGKAAFDVDGEDKVGRSKGRRLTPSELVSYCFDTAESFAQQANDRGHVFQVPGINEIAETFDSK
jgi:hypothetical protein